MCGLDDESSFLTTSRASSPELLKKLHSLFVRSEILLPKQRVCLKDGHETQVVEIEPLGQYLCAEQNVYLSISEVLEHLLLPPCLCAGVGVEPGHRPFRKYRLELLLNLFRPGSKGYKPAVAQLLPRLTSTVPVQNLGVPQTGGVRHVMPRMWYVFGPGRRVAAMVADETTARFLQVEAHVAVRTAYYCPTFAALYRRRVGLPCTQNHCLTSGFKRILENFDELSGYGADHSALLPFGVCVDDDGFRIPVAVEPLVEKYLAEPPAGAVVEGFE